jgi:hypothetical protein
MKGDNPYEQSDFLSRGLSGVSDYMLLFNSKSVLN